jgi:hypothetical protein
MEAPVRKLLAIVIAAALASALAVVCGQVGMNATKAAFTRPKPDYALKANPYLPLRELEPVY